MKKELIILEYSINVENLTRQQVDNRMHEYATMINNTFNDSELKENHIVKNIFLPSDKTKIECIYPIGNNTTIDIDIEAQLKKVETKILKLKDPKLWDEWNILMRWVKLKKIKEV